MDTLNYEAVLRALQSFPKEICIDNVMTPVDAEVLRWYVAFKDLFQDWIDHHAKCECGHFHCLSCKHYHGYSKGCSWGKTP